MKWVFFRGFFSATAIIRSLGPCIEQVPGPRQQYRCKQSLNDASLGNKTEEGQKKIKYKQVYFVVDEMVSIETDEMFAIFVLQFFLKRYESTSICYTTHYLLVCS